jgi:excisionase family DNA binding protein
MGDDELSASTEWERRGSAEVLTIQDVAAYLKLPLSTVYRLVGRGELPGQKMGRQWRFHKAALDEWFRHGRARRVGT